MIKKYLGDAEANFTKVFKKWLEGAATLLPIPGAALGVVAAETRITVEEITP